MSIADDTMKVAYQAMGGLAHRQKVRANNIANAETPGFRARDVPFEAELARQIGTGGLNRPVATPVTVRDTLPDIHGNTVELEVEMVEMLEDQVRFDAMVSAFDHKIRVLRSAIGGR